MEPVKLSTCPFFHDDFEGGLDLTVVFDGAVGGDVFLDSHHTGYAGGDEVDGGGELELLFDGCHAGEGKLQALEGPAEIPGTGYLEGVDLVLEGRFLGFGGGGQKGVRLCLPAGQAAGMDRDGRGIF